MCLGRVPVLLHVKNANSCTKIGGTLDVSLFQRCEEKLHKKWERCFHDHSMFVSFNLIDTIREIHAEKETIKFSRY